MPEPTDQSSPQYEPTPLPSLVLTRPTSGIGEGAMLGPYRIVELLGEGSGGRVYRAVHTRLDRQVAVKLLRSEHAHKQHLVKRFFQEARAANQIEHENIVAITDLVTDEDDRCYIIMELLRGESLEDVLVRDRRVSLERALHISRQICSAMHAAHRAGIVHRDLKPGNVFLTDRGERRDFVKLLDFGVAKITLFCNSEDGEPESVGTLLGTPEYMSPEQADGRPVDHRADVYALGVMLYEMVTGERPFHHETLQGTLENHRKHTPPKPSSFVKLPSGVRERLDRLVLRCIAKQPDERPEDMGEILEELDGLATELVRPKSSASLLALFGLLMAIACTSIYLVIRDVKTEAAQMAPQALMPAPRGSVRLTFLSRPSGAEVVRAATGQSLGRTPLVIDLVPTPEPERFELRKRGFQHYEHLVTLTQDDTLSADLSPR